MATITVHVPWPLRNFSGAPPQIALQSASVREALSALERDHPSLHAGICDETGKVRRHINLFVNKSHIRDRDGLDTRFAQGDELVILPAVSGG